MCPTTMEMRDVREAESFLNTMCPTTAGMGDVWEAESFFGRLGAWSVSFKPSR